MNRGCEREPSPGSAMYTMMGALLIVLIVLMLLMLGGGRSDITIRIGPSATPSPAAVAPAAR